MVEDEVSALGGHKSLYSTSFYSEDEFRGRYNGPAYDKLKAEYDGDGRLLTSTTNVCAAAEQRRPKGRTEGTVHGTG